MLNAIIYQVNIGKTNLSKVLGCTFKVQLSVLLWGFAQKWLLVVTNLCQFV